MDYGCAKCYCRKFAPSSPGKFDDRSGRSPDWLVKPSRKCLCGHKDNEHTVTKEPVGEYGAIATFFSQGSLRVVPIIGKRSREEAESVALRTCVQACSNTGGSNPKIRMWGFKSFLAIAQGDDDKVGWCSAPYKRAEAERDAVKACRKRNPPLAFSIHSAWGGEHLHIGEPYCRK